MKTLLQIAGTLLSSSLMLTSCLTVYVPNAVNTPLLQEKGEFKAAIATNNLQLSTALTDHVGVMVNGYLNSHTSDDKTFRNHGKGAEAGIGYFAHTSNRITYEAFGGVGLYHVRIKEANAAKTFDANATKYFLQPSVGWVNQYVEVALSPRLTVVKYGQPDITGYSREEQVRNYFDNVNHKAHAFLEPTLTVRGGYRFVKLQLQIGHSYKLSEGAINNDTGIGSIGLIFDIGQWYRTTK
jgi:hypothetical protein